MNFMTSFFTYGIQLQGSWPTFDKENLLGWLRISSKQIMQSLFLSDVYIVLTIVESLNLSVLTVGCKRTP